MQQDTIIVTNNNVNPVQCICVNKTDTLAEPSSDVTTPVDYDSLTDPQKIQFDDCINMILSLV